VAASWDGTLAHPAAHTILWVSCFVMQEPTRPASVGGPWSDEPLSPVNFLRRAAFVNGDGIAVRDGSVERTYAELWERARLLAGTLVGSGVRPGDRVAVLAPNTETLLEAHFGVPLAGAVLVALNTRLTAAELAYIIEHSGARLLIHDGGLAPLADEATALLANPIPLIAAGAVAGPYDEWLQSAQPTEVACQDERALLALNYTSGTTGRPKGVMYTHRGAYLQALSMVIHAGLTRSSKYLWVLPMFHCNGWCFPWAVTAIAAQHVCLRRVEPAAIWTALSDEGITHLCAAPTVLTSLAVHEQAARAPQAVHVCTGGAPPSPALLERMADLNVDITHLYGLTETYGPSVVCEWRAQWAGADAERRAELKARQGVPNIVGLPLRVTDQSGADIPHDGDTLGEVRLRGNTVMAGYYRDPETTASTVGDGWLRTGDLAVVHDDNYLELRDRAKDVIISGGENIASIEVEHAIASHPDVLEVAVIGVPHERWGETPAAYVTLRDGAAITAEDITAHARLTLPGFKTPRQVIFGPLPKTATGKIQKFRLRERAWAGKATRIGG
jgi:fatty-acyl-CoA synthase